MRLNSPPYPYPPKNNSTVAHGGNPMISTLYRSNTRICQQHRKKYSRETKRELLPYRNRVRHAHRSYRTARSIGDGGHFFAWVATRIPPCVSGERGGPKRLLFHAKRISHLLLRARAFVGADRMIRF